MKLINKEDTRILHEIQAKDSYPKAIRRSIIIGIIVGVLMGTLYYFFVERKETEVGTNSVEFGFVFGLLFTALLCLFTCLSIYNAKRSLSKK